MYKFRNMPILFSIWPYFLLSL